jgi:hypothetical protein
MRPPKTHDEPAVSFERLKITSMPINDLFDATHRLNDGGARAVSHNALSHKTLNCLKL